MRHPSVNTYHCTPPNFNINFLRCCTDRLNSPQLLMGGLPSILLRKSKTDQDATGKWLHLSHKAHLALMEWMKELPKGQEYLMVGIDRGGRISRSSLGSGQVNRIYKRIARNAGLDESVIEGISGHSMRVGAAQDLLNSGASMPIIMQRGRWSKTDTVMRYVEQINQII